MNCCSCSNDIVGYRFHPSDKELIDHYLWNKSLDRDSAVQAIGEVTGDLCDWEPEDLPRFSVIRSNDRTWYLFSRRKNNKRVKRKTKFGYWKLTGKHRSIEGKIGIGTKKTLVFYEGRFPKGKWTPWVIHEYTLPDTLPNQKGVFLCKLKKKDDEKAGISCGEKTHESRPSNEDDRTFDNSSEIDCDELLAQLGNGSEEVDDEVASTLVPRAHVPVVSCNGGASSIVDFDGVYHQTSTNEQNDELYAVSSALQSLISHDDFSSFYGPNGNFHEIQHQSITHEQDDKNQHQPSTNEQDGEARCQPTTSTNEQDDELLNYIVFDDDDDERSNEHFCWSEDFSFR